MFRLNLILIVMDRFLYPYINHTQGAEVTGQLRVNGKLWHLRRCTLDGWSLAVLILHLHIRQISFSNMKNYSCSVFWSWRLITYMYYLLTTFKCYFKVGVQ